MVLHGCSLKRLVWQPPWRLHLRSASGGASCPAGWRDTSKEAHVTSFVFTEGLTLADPLKRSLSLHPTLRTTGLG